MCTICPTVLSLCRTEKKECFYVTLKKKKKKKTGFFNIILSTTISGMRSEVLLFGGTKFLFIIL